MYYYIIILFIMAVPSFAQEQKSFSIFFPHTIEKKHILQNKDTVLKKESFDFYKIFDIESNAMKTLEQVQFLKKEFRKKERQLRKDIKAQEQHIERLLINQLSDIESSEEILKEYIYLYELITKYTELAKQHTMELQEIFNNSFTNYRTTVESKIKYAEKNPKTLSEALLYRYKIYLEESTIE